MKYGLKQLRKDFPNDKACLQFAFDALHSRECSCGGQYKPSKARKTFYCSKCRTIISPFADTIMAKSSTPPRKWFQAILLVGDGATAKDIQRELGVTYKTAWRLKHIIQKSTKDGVVQVLTQDKTSWQKWYARNKERVSAYNKEYEKKNYNRLSEKRRQRHANDRIECLKKYSKDGVPVCICCGEKEVSFLSIDHINGKQGRTRKTVGQGLYRKLLKKHDHNIQILCFNCNLAKGFYGVCPHNKI